MPPSELHIPGRERGSIMLVLDPSAEGPGHVYVHRRPGATFTVRHVPAQRVPYVAELEIELPWGRNVSVVEASTLDMLGVLLREAVISEAGADALTCMSAKRRAA